MRYWQLQKQRYAHLQLFIASLLLFLGKLYAQTAKANFNLDAPTTTTYTTDTVSSAPLWYLDSNGVLSGSNARMGGNGYVFDYGDFACSRAPATNIRVDTDFSIELWVYVEEQNQQQSVVCREFIQAGNYFNERFCIRINNNKFEVSLNTASRNAGNSIQTITYNLNPDRKFILIIFKVGWNHVVFTFRRYTMGIKYTEIVGYLNTDAGTSQSDTNTWSDQMDDANGGVLCAGGQLVGTSTTLKDPFTGVLNQVTMYNNDLSAAQVSSLFSTNCQAYCNICKISGSAPYACIQQSPGFFQSYDFSAVNPYATTVPDASGNGYTMAIAANFDITPVFVHNEGLCFDPYFQTSNPQYIISSGSDSFGTTSSSFTIEAWIKPVTFDNPTRLIYEKTNGASVYFEFYMANNNKFFVSINGVTRQFNPTGWNSATENDKWHYAALSIRQLSTTTTEACFKLSDRNINCKTINSVFVDTGTMTTRIGYNFNGCIRDLKVYDYAKIEMDMESMYNINGQTCTIYNTQGCLYCPRSNGFKCISDCPTSTYGTQCTYCYSNCRSCYGPQYNQCYSCFTSWTFDYVNSCRSQCGDGIKDDVEACDDGNVVSGDGCSSTCVTESGYICFGGGFSNSDTCYEKCGDGIVISSAICDDGNVADGDGCDQLCNIETGFTCTGSPSVCKATCGDSRKVGTETCDDGNVVSGDGCTLLCKIETGYKCVGGTINSKDTCTEICGDGLDYGKYGCEGGNAILGDGCNPNCLVEVGYSCAGGTIAKSDTCTPICGDGRRMTGEACDDGNAINGDGCSLACVVETGYVCTGGDKYNNDVCTEICGDSKNFGINKCDDGNVVSSDGCHSDCTVEIGWVCSGGTSTNKDTCLESCGDGRNMGSYACDDGNNASGDGCTSKCVLETGWTCTTGDKYTGSVCTRTCNGFREFVDMCDDGNVINSDGCDYCCKREIGYMCSGGSTTTSDTCTETCGDGRKSNILPCDDGNQVSGDGCTIACKIETGFTCSGGTISNPDICLETCGDGLNFGYYGCDDGNSANLDGCSATCRVENGFTCSGGSSASKDVCIETCGDGKNMKKNACDDGNIVSGDGCSSTCTLETGYVCSQGNSYSPDICYEICGDGKNMGNLQCDDGNIKDGDGCTGKCSIEVGYACFGGTSLKADLCYALSAPSITSAYFTSDNTQIIMNFNETVYMLPKWNQTNSWSLQMDGPLGKANYKFTWNITRSADYKANKVIGTTQLILDFNCSQQLFGNSLEKVRIDFNDRSQIRSTLQKVQMVNTTITVSPYGQEDLSEDSQSSICGFPTMMGTLTEAAVYGSFAFGFLGTFFGIPLTDTFMMMNGLQTAYLFPTLQTYMPSCMTRYVWKLKIGFPESDIMARTLFAGVTNHTNIDSINPAPYNFQKMGMESTAILRSGDDILSLGVYLFLMTAIFEAAYFLFEGSVFLRNLLQRFKSSVPFAFMEFAFMKLALVSQLNVANVSFEDGQAGLSTLLSLAIIVSLYAYFFYMCFQSFKFYKEVKAIKQILKDEHNQAQTTISRNNNLADMLSSKSLPRQITEQDIKDKTYFRGMVLFEDISIQSPAYPFSIVYHIVVMGKKLVLSALLTTNSYQTELIGFMLMNVVSLTAIYMLRPYKSNLLNAQAIFNDIMLFLIFMHAHRFIPRSLVDVAALTKDSQVMIFLIMVLTFTNALFVILSKLALLIRCRNLIRERQAQAQVNFQVDVKGAIQNMMTKRPQVSPSPVLNNTTQQTLLDSTAKPSNLKQTTQAIKTQSALNGPKDPKASPQVNTAPGTPVTGTSVNLDSIKALQNMLQNRQALVNKSTPQIPVNSRLPVAKSSNNRNNTSDIREETKSFESSEDEEIEITNSYDDEEYDDESGSYQGTSRGNSRINASYNSARAKRR